MMAGSVVALEVARVYLLESLHRRGVAQAPLSVLIGLSWILMVPGDRLLDLLRSLPLLDRLIVALNAWRVFLVLSFLFYFAAFRLLGSINGRLNRRIAGEPAKPTVDPGAGPLAEPAPRRVTRRRLLGGAKRTAIAGAVAAGVYPMLGEPHRLVVTRRTFPVCDLPPELDGLRIVQLTDIHHGPWTTIGRVRRIVELTNSLQPDLVALTGDYIQRHKDYAAPVAASLAGLRAKVGIVGVLGNHDWWLDGPLCTRELTRAGVRMIDNDRVFVTPSRALDARGAAGLCIAGVGDLMTHVQHYDRALAGVAPDVPRLLLSHNPDVAEERAFVTSGHRVDLMLSGHTHGGQIAFPGIGPLVTMSRYGRKYARGLVNSPVCPVYVSRGLGMAMLPLRLGSTPEIAVIELKGM
jgi:hypothetical protein